MADTTPFTIGAGASCTDGVCGKVTGWSLTRSPVLSPTSWSNPSTAMTPAGLFLLTLSTPRRAKSGSAAPWRTSRSSIPPRRRSSCRAPPDARAMTRNRCSTCPITARGWAWPGLTPR